MIAFDGIAHELAIARLEHVQGEACLRKEDQVREGEEGEEKRAFRQGIPHDAFFALPTISNRLQSIKLMKRRMEKF
jgi:hypothetical protein